MANLKGFRDIHVSSQSCHIQALPFDVLWDICKLVCDDTADFKTQNLETFQLVCREFRRIALQIPQLWSCVDDNMTVERMKLQFSRSGRVGMSFRIVYSDDPMPELCVCPRWELIKSHHARWICGTVWVTGWSPVKGHDCINTLKAFHLPRLTSLSLDTYHLRGTLGEFKWEMPELEVLVSRSDEDTLLSLSAPLKQLTFVSDSDRDGMWQSWMLNYLATPMVAPIRSLTLDFSMDCGFSPFDEPSGDVDHVELHQLESLDANLGAAGNDMQEIGFLQQLDTPSLKNLCLRINPRLAEEEEVWVWLAGMVPPHLERLEVTIAVIKPGAAKREALRCKVMGCFPDLSLWDVNNLETSGVVVTQKKRKEVMITLEGSKTGLS